MQIIMYFQYTNIGLLSLDWKNILAVHLKLKLSIGSIKFCKDFIAFYK